MTIHIHTKKVMRLLAIPYVWLQKKVPTSQLVFFYLDLATTTVRGWRMKYTLASCLFRHAKEGSQNFSSTELSYLSTHVAEKLIFTGQKAVFTHYVCCWENHLYYMYTQKYFFDLK